MVVKEVALMWDDELGKENCELETILDGRGHGNELSSEVPCYSCPVAMGGLIFVFSLVLAGPG